MRKLVVVCAYRVWAREAFIQLSSNPILSKFYDFQLAESIDELFAIYESELKPQILMCIGWSWKIPTKILEQSYVCGVHPSDLPKFAGGSPIQHQILAGIEDSQITLFKFTELLDSGPILFKSKLSLSGGMQDIFRELTRTSVMLTSAFLTLYPKVIEEQMESPIKKFKRLTAKESELTLKHLHSMSAREIYDFIRCREDPYPNAFLRDNSGIVTFKAVEFYPQSNPSTFSNNEDFEEMN